MGAARTLLVMQHDAVQHKRCLMLFARILHQGFADLIALTTGDSLLSDNGRKMPTAERAETLAEVTDWFFSDSDSPVSLTAVCDHLDINASWMRARARQIIAGSKQIALRR